MNDGRLHYVLLVFSTKGTQLGRHDISVSEYSGYSELMVKVYEKMTEIQKLNNTDLLTFVEEK